MQKEKTSRFPPLIVVMSLLLGVAQAFHAEEAAAQADAATGGLDQNATMGDMIKLAKQAGEREFAARLNPASKTASKDPVAEPVTEMIPVLLALYGIDRNYKAELEINGQSRVVTVPGPLSKMGPWKYIALTEEGVLLTKSAQYINPPAGANASSGTRSAIASACQQKETCLFLSVPKGGGDSRSRVTPDAQARLLARQLPGGSRAPALEFGGKPQPLEDHINMGNTKPMSR